MRELLSHSENTGNDIDVAQFVAKGRDASRAIEAELSGSFQRWEMQMLSLDKVSHDLEHDLRLLKQHVSSVHESESQQEFIAPPIKADTFTTEEHRTFLDRCMRAMRGNS